MGIMSSTDLKRLHENSESKSQNTQDLSKEQQERLDLFMEGGGCKESFKALNDCVKEEEDKCWQEMEKCMEAHSDYYQPYLVLKETIAELVMSDMEAYFQEKVKEETYEQQIHKFMKTGPCKETIIAWIDSPDSPKHSDVSEKETMCKCLEAHPDYYQPYHVAKKYFEEHYIKELDAFLSKLRKE